MIIKRNLKSQMPNLKRCRIGDAVGEDDEITAARKKRKLNGYYPLSLLGEVAAGIIPLNFHNKGISASWCTQISCSTMEMESKSNSRDSSAKEALKPPAEIPRPPLVRTSRGRVQVLPSRFNDSVIENWKKDGKTSLQDYGLDEEFKCKKEKFSFKTPRICNGTTAAKKLGFKFVKCPALCEQEEDEPAGMELFKNFDFRKYSSSRSSLTSVHETVVEDEKFQVDVVCEDVINLKETKPKDGLYGPEDFYAGDIVWAKAGKKEPFWPAIVIDPITQAPELVLRACVADAACIMFFGYSGNENQRVWMDYGYNFFFFLLWKSVDLCCKILNDHEQDYAWVRRGMIFPFMDFIDRYSSL